MNVLRDIARVLAGLWALPFTVAIAILGIVQAMLGLIADAPKLIGWKLTAWVLGAKLERLKRQRELRDQLGPSGPRGL